MPIKEKLILETKKIYKYPINIQGNVILDIPEGGRILTFKTQFNKPCLWILVDTEKPIKQRRFQMFGTGHPLTENVIEHGDYIGTTMTYDESMVWHLFEIPIKGD